MSAFTTAVRTSNDPSQGVLRTRGENGMPELTVAGHGYSPLAYFEKTCRDLEFARHLQFINTCIREAESENDATKVVELFLMMFQTRACRGGKGDKLPFYNMMQILYTRFPATCLSLIEDIPHYGYWKDLLLLIRHVKMDHFQGVDYSPLINRCYEVMAKAIQDDYAKLQSGSKDLSFVGKFAPRGGKEFDKKFGAVSEIIKYMYPELVGSALLGKPKQEITEAWNHAKKEYRKVVVALAMAINVPEQLMCSLRWQEINFAKNVTSLCMSRNMNAFLNQTKNGQVKHPGVQDRILCAEHVIENLSKLAGKVLDPHELVEKVLHERNLPSASKAVISAQWNKIREGTIEHAVAQAAGEGNDSFQLSNLVPMADVSGSMSGIPMKVCIALSILLSEITNEKFRDLILTFSSDCRWEDFSDCTTFVDKVQKLSRMHWGMSTNFTLAMERIAKIVKDNGLSVEQTPDLVVFSDMQFDDSYNERSYYSYSSSENQDWSTMYETNVAMFHDLGMEMDGVPRPVPKIVFWNLRSDTVGYPVEANQPGVVTMSGYNPSLMKFFLTGQLNDGVEEEVVDEETGEVKTVRREITPLDNFKTIMSDSMLDIVRAKLVLSQEGILANFGTQGDPNEATLFE